MSQKPTQNRRARPTADPLTSALRRLLTATDRNLRAAEELRHARVKLAKLIEDRRND